MIKGLLYELDGKATLLIGLSDGNIEKLRSGQPIRFDASAKPPMGVDLPTAPVVVIMHGETEEAIVTELRAHGLMPEN